MDSEKNLPPQNSSPNGKILVAEDNLMNQKVIQTLLRKEGYEVSVVSNGKEALLALEQQSFKGLILDYQMPELDGLQTLQAIRKHANAHIQSLPVIFLTAELDPENLKEVEQLGVAHMLSKPIEPKKLMQAVAQLDSQTPLPEPGTSNLTTSYLYTITDGNLGVMLELIDIFLEEAPLAIQKIKSSYAVNDSPALLKTIHKIRSNFKYVGMLAIEKMLSDLEQDVEYNRNPDTFEHRIKEIEELSLKFLQDLKQEKLTLHQKLNSSE